MDSIRQYLPSPFKTWDTPVLVLSGVGIVVLACAGITGIASLVTSTFQQDDGGASKKPAAVGSSWYPEWMSWAFPTAVVGAGIGTAGAVAAYKIKNRRKADASQPSKSKVARRRSSKKAGAKNGSGNSTNYTPIIFGVVLIVIVATLFLFWNQSEDKKLPYDHECPA